jgi:hypothetical protein
MLGIFVSGLILLAALVFAAGLLIGREWGASEAAQGPGAKPGGGMNLAPALMAPVAPAVPAVPAVPAATLPAMPAVPLVAPAMPQVPAVPAVPQLPIVPAAPQLPAAPKPPSLPALPAAPQAPVIPAVPPLPTLPKPSLPTRSSDAGAVRAPELATLSREASVPAEKQSAPESVRNREDARPASTPANRYVVYAGAFESSVKAEGLVEELKRRGLAAETREVSKPGSKALFAVRVGPFDSRGQARAVLPEIREAGADGSTIHAVP